jgi:hypothetical protein
MWPKSNKILHNQQKDRRLRFFLKFLTSDNRYHCKVGTFSVLDLFAVWAAYIKEAYLQIGKHDVFLGLVHWQR